ncbi:MAG: ABC transporter ATP-binding protein, partial [Clostridiales bacterium]
MDLLQVKDLSKVYHTRLGGHSCMALNDISFEVTGGEFLAVMGASGSGKTTLLNLIASLDKPSGGQIILDGQSFAAINDRELSSFRRQNLGFVFQDYNLLDTFTVKDNILLPLVLSRVGVAEMEQKLKPLAERLGLSGILHKYPYEISGGEKQRTAVARAVITAPRLILADEPTGALDSHASTNLLEIFSELNQQGQTIVMVTHSAFAASFAKRVLLIQDGRLFRELRREKQERR